MRAASALFWGGGRQGKNGRLFEVANYRQDKINSAVTEEMAKIIREIKDPRVADAFVTVTSARVSADLKYCRLYFSSLSGDEGEIMRGLRSASGFIRSRLAERLNLRVTPELTFEADRSIEHGAHIAEILKKIENERREKGVEENND